MNQGGTLTDSQIPITSVVGNCGNADTCTREIMGKGNATTFAVACQKSSRYCSSACDASRQQRETLLGQHRCTMASIINMNNVGVSHYESDKDGPAMDAFRFCMSRLDLMCTTGCLGHIHDGVYSSIVDTSSNGRSSHSPARNTNYGDGTKKASQDAVSIDDVGDITSEAAQLGYNHKKKQLRRYLFPRKRRSTTSLSLPMSTRETSYSSPSTGARKKPIKNLLRRCAASDLLQEDGSHENGCYTSLGRNVPQDQNRYQQNRTQYIYQRNEYDEGMDCYPNVRSIHISLLDDLNASSFNGQLRDSNQDVTVTVVVATVLLNIGKVYHKRDQPEDALKAYRRALSCVQSLWNARGHEHQKTQDALNAAFPNCSCPLSVEILHGNGQMLYYRGENEESLAMYIMALDMARLKSSPVAKEGGLIYGKAEVAAALNCVGVLQYHMSSGEVTTQAALGNFNESLEIRRNVLGLVHRDVATVYNNIGRILFQRGAHESSMVAYGEAIKIRRLLFDDNNLDVAATVFNMGQSHHQKGNHAMALALYEEFARVAKMHLGASHRDLAIVTTCIAQIRHERKDYDEALSLYTDALLLGKSALGEFHPEIAITYNKIGNLLYERGDLEGSLRAYQHGLRVERHVLEPTNPNIVVTLTNIAEIYKQKEEHNKAMDKYREALHLQRQNGECTSIDISSTLNSIGMIHFQREEFMEALDYYQEALQIRREKLGDNGVDVAASLTNIGLVLLKKGLQDMAISVFLEALRIRREAFGEVHREVAFTTYHIAMVYHQRGDYEQAMTFYTETMRIEKSVLGPDHADVGITWYQIAQLQFQCGEVDKALNSYHQALALERKSFGDCHPSVARTLNDIGNCHLQKGNIDAVMSSFTEALRIYRKAGLSPDNLVVKGKNLYAFDAAYPEAAGAA